MSSRISVASHFDANARAVVFNGDCLELLAEIPNDSVQLVVTSPPYNIGKVYEKRIELNEYVEQQARVIAGCARILRPSGSICWQVGNYVDKKEGYIVPLDSVLYPVFKGLGLKMRNRIIWHFEHGLR